MIGLPVITNLDLKIIKYDWPCPKIWCGHPPLWTKILLSVLMWIGISECKSICLQWRRPRFNPWVGKIPWRRKWQPPPVFLPGKSHGPRSLIDSSPWGHKESDTTEWLHFTSPPRSSGQKPDLLWPCQILDYILWNMIHDSEEIMANKI